MAPRSKGAAKPDGIQVERYLHKLPIRQPLDVYTTIEMPGPVTSVERAFESLGGFNAVSRSLDKYEADHSSAQDADERQKQADKGGVGPSKSTASSAFPVTLSLVPGEWTRHPIEGSTVETSSLLLKVIKRKRRRPKDNGQVGVYAVEVAGLVDKAVRFRAMNDYQYQPDLKDNIHQVTQAVRNMDVEGILNFEWKEPSEDFDPLAALPPPIFSRVPFQSYWNFSASSLATPVETIRMDGLSYVRLRNVGRKTFKPIPVIAHNDPVLPEAPALEDEADGPKRRRSRKGKGKARQEESGDEEEAEQEEVARSHADLTALLRRLLLQRPMWTRNGLLNQLSPELRRIASNNKEIISNAGYSFSNGPFKEMVIRYGYDPRTDPEAALLQRIQIRNAENKRQTSKSQQVTGGDLSKSHTFDGKKAESLNGSFQICDITDPLFVERSREGAARLDHCSDRVDGHGWWDDTWYEMLRTLIKVKFHAALKGEPIMDDTELDQYNPGIRQGDPRGESSTFTSPHRSGSGSSVSSSASGAPAAAQRQAEPSATGQRKRWQGRKSGTKKRATQPRRDKEGPNVRIKRKLVGASAQADGDQDSEDQSGGAEGQDDDDDRDDED